MYVPLAAVDMPCQARDSQQGYWRRHPVSRAHLPTLELPHANSLKDVDRDLPSPGAEPVLLLPAKGSGIRLLHDTLDMTEVKPLAIASMWKRIAP